MSNTTIKMKALEPFGLAMCRLMVTLISFSGAIEVKDCLEMLLFQ